MIRLLQFLIFGHVHKWETVGRSSWKTVGEFGSELESGPRFVCKCEKCGAYRTFDL